MIEAEGERKCDDGRTMNQSQMMWDHEPRNGQSLEAGKGKGTDFPETVEGTKPW